MKLGTTLKDVSLALFLKKQKLILFLKKRADLIGSEQNHSSYSVGAQALSTLDKLESTSDG